MASKTMNEDDAEFISSSIAEAKKDRTDLTFGGSLPGPIPECNSVSPFRYTDDIVSEEQSYHSASKKIQPQKGEERRAGIEFSSDYVSRSAATCLWPRVRHGSDAVL
jgi:hypothetical protein